VATTIRTSRFFDTSKRVPIYDSILGADAASIDTGANAIDQAFAAIEVIILARTTEAVDLSSVAIRVNGDSGANYDLVLVQANNTTAQAAQTLVATSWGHTVPGANGETGAVAEIRFVILGYAATTFHKVAEGSRAVPDDTAANNRAVAFAHRWKSTNAINQLSVAAASGNLKAGSRLTIIPK
jgi:hypothetical protein